MSMRATKNGGNGDFIHPYTSCDCCNILCEFKTFEKSIKNELRGWIARF